VRLADRGAGSRQRPDRISRRKVQKGLPNPPKTRPAGLQPQDSSSVRRYDNPPNRTRNSPAGHYIITTRPSRTGLPCQPQYCSTLQNICSPHGLAHSRLPELPPCCAAPLTWLFSVRDFDPSSKRLGLGRLTPNHSRTKRKLLELGPSDCLRPTPASANAKPFVGSAPHVLCSSRLFCCIRLASGHCSHRDPTCLTSAKAHIHDCSQHQHQFATLDICTRHCAMGVSKTPLIGLLTSRKAAA
jgi:hypothetical protein